MWSNYLHQFCFLPRIVKEVLLPKSQYETEALERMKKESRRRQWNIQMDIISLEEKLRKHWRKRQPDIQIDSRKRQPDIQIDMWILEDKLMELIKDQQWELEKYLTLMEENLNLERLTEMMEKQRSEHETMIKKQQCEREKKEKELITRTKEYELKVQQDEAMIKELRNQIKPVGDAPKQSNLADLDIRLGTFKDWPADSPVPPRALAEAGFYHDKDSSSLPLPRDCCRCFYCGVRVHGWKLGDDPFVEHAQSPITCPFIKQCKGETFIQAAQKHAKNGDQVPRKQVEMEISATGQKKKTAVSPVEKGVNDEGSAELDKTSSKPRSYVSAVRRSSKKTNSFTCTVPTIAAAYLHSLCYEIVTQSL